MTETNSHSLETVQVANPEAVEAHFTSFPIPSRPENQYEEDIIGILNETSVQLDGSEQNLKLVADGVMRAMKHHDKINDLAHRQDLVDAHKQKIAIEDQRDMAEHIAETDGLTGLRNKRALEQELENRIKDGRVGKLALVFLDLDGFKAVNDQKGHAVGDEVLAKVGQYLKESFKLRDDEEAFRFGGDEFVLLVDSEQESNQERTPDLTEEQVIKGLIARLNRGIKTETKIIDEDIDVSGSFGYAKYENGESSVDFISRADKKMYENKQERKKTGQETS